jgi:hypothetical protein
MPFNRVQFSIFGSKFGHLLDTSSKSEIQNLVLKSTATKKAQGGVMDTIDIKILGWEKFNPRKDFKAPRWFALSNRILEDASLFDLTAEEFKVWIYVLCQASQKNSGDINLNTSHASKISNLNKRVLVTALNKLEKAKCILVVRDLSAESRTESVRDLYANVQATNATLHYITEQNTTEHYNAQSGDFADFYSGYPRKLGKSKAKQIYDRAIKNGAKHEDIIFARDVYKKHCFENKIETKYILHASTFMNQWTDWTAPDAGESESFAVGQSFAEKFKGVFDEND